MSAILAEIIEILKQKVDEMGLFVSILQITFQELVSQNKNDPEDRAKVEHCLHDVGDGRNGL